MASSNSVGWFELPVGDMDRAIAFYETIFQIKMERRQMEGLDMAWFPYDDQGSGAAGSLVYNEEFYSPSKEGVLVYFTSHSGDLANELGRVEAAGGEVLIEKRQIAPDVGYMGVFIDSEGNRVALHSRE